MLTSTHHASVSTQRMHTGPANARINGCVSAEGEHVCLCLGTCLAVSHCISAGQLKVFRTHVGHAWLGTWCLFMGLLARVVIS